MAESTPAAEMGGSTRNGIQSILVGLPFGQRAAGGWSLCREDEFVAAASLRLLVSRWSGSPLVIPLIEDGKIDSLWKRFVVPQSDAVLGVAFSSGDGSIQSRLADSPSVTLALDLARGVCGSNTWIQGFISAGCYRARMERSEFMATQNRGSVRLVEWPNRWPVVGCYDFDTADSEQHDFACRFQPGILVSRLYYFDPHLESEDGPANGAKAPSVDTPPGEAVLQWLRKTHIPFLPIGSSVSLGPVEDSVVVVTTPSGFRRELGSVRDERGRVIFGYWEETKHPCPFSGAAGAGPGNRDELKGEIDEDDDRGGQ